MSVMHHLNYVLIFIAAVIGPAVRAHLGGRNSEKYTTTPQGAVRVRAPRFQLVAGIILPFIGIPSTIGGVFLIRYAFISWSAPEDPRSVSPDQLTPLSLIAVAVFAAGIFFTTYSFLIIMSVRNEYVETGIDYVEKRERLGKITRILFHEISSYSYSPRSEGGKLKISTSDGRRISFLTDYYRGNYVVSVIAFRVANGHWPNPTDPATHSRLVQSASNGTAKRYLSDHKKAGSLGTSQIHRLQNT